MPRISLQLTLKLNSELTQVRLTDYYEHLRAMEKLSRKCLELIQIGAIQRCKNILLRLDSGDQAATVVCLITESSLQ